jgi:hypothetical protein
MRVVGLLLLLTPFLVYGQETPSHNTKLRTDLAKHVQDLSEVDGTANEMPDFSKFIRKLEEKESQKNGVKFCRALFQKTRQEYLRQYAQYASFTETLDKGKYNCLTGTALYAILLDHFGFDYSVIETNYHIFLIASTAEGKVLFEATDPVNGFVTSQAEIEKRIQQYKQNTVQQTAGASKKYYEYNVNLYQQVSLDEMVGLLHYNFSIEAYNKQNFEGAIQHLDHALSLYNSARITEFASILLLSVMENKQLDRDLKEGYISRIQAIRKKQLPVLARRIYAH